MFDLNLTLPIFVVSFLIFMWALNEVFLKPVGKALEMRASKVQADIEAGKAARNDAERILQDYETNLHKIRHEAQSVINQSIEDANKSRSKELSRISAEGQAKLEKAKTEIQAERAGLIDALVTQERELVETITRKVLGDENVQVNVDAGQVRHALEEAC